MFDLEKKSRRQLCTSNSQCFEPALNQIRLKAGVEKTNGFKNKSFFLFFVVLWFLGFNIES